MSELNARRYSALRDLLQVLNDYFGAEAISAEFPPDLSACIANYVQVHEKGEHYHESRKILEELKELSTRNASRGDSKLPLLLKCLKELKEVLDPEDVVDVFEEWILRPILHPYGQNRQTLSDARDVLLFCLVPQDNTEGERRMFAIHYRLFEIYIRKSKEVLQGVAAMQTLPAVKFTITTVEKVLLDFGDKCPKEFLTAVDRYYLSKENRLVVSGLMCRFSSAHDHHLYKVLDTGLLDHVLQCLEIDTSNGVVTMSLTVLVMLLPNVCNSISKQLPELFFILYRIMCWRQELNRGDDEKDQYAEEQVWPLGNRRESWEAADASEDSFRSSGPKADQLFTFLYGLFPVNLLKFLQAPCDYLDQHHILMTSRDEVFFKAQAEVLLARHTFNPDILKYSAETEVNDNARWTEFEPGEIAAKCSTLDSANKLYSGKGEPKAAPPTGPLPKPPSNSALSKSLDYEAQRNLPFPRADFMSGPTSWIPRSRNSNGASSSVVDDVPGSPFSQGGPRRVNGSVTSNGTETVGGFYGEEDQMKPREFATDAPFASRLSMSDVSTTLDDKKHTPDNHERELPDSYAAFENEFQMMNAQLEFERLLKRRYLQQIARLQRKKVLHSSSEAEREHYVPPQLTLPNDNQVTEIADLKRQVNELMDDLHRQQQSSAQYKQQRAAVEESLYQKIKVVGDDKNHFKAEAARLQVEAERLQQENGRLRKNQISLDAEIMKTRQGSQEALDQENSAASAKIESLKAEITEWKDKVGSQRELELQKQKLEAACKRLEMKLAVAEEQNRTMSRRLTQLIAETANGIKQQPTHQPKFRTFLDSVAKTHSAELTQLRDTHDTLLKQYRSLEDSYRELQLAREAERREMLARQRQIQPVSTEPAYPRGLLDDGLSLDSRLGKMPWDQESRSTDVNSGGSSETGISRVDTVTDNAMGQIPMVGSLRASGATSPIDSSNPFSSVLPRRPTVSSTSSSTKAAKIKPNSEIRIYGRGGAQNMGMKPKKEKKAGLNLG